MNTLPLQPLRFAALSETFYSRVRTEPLENARWAAANLPFAEQLGIAPDRFQTAENLALLSGNATGERLPVATVYSGHQFGGYTPRLGDGRAVLIGESVDASGARWEWQLKGAGKTPYSRFADGRAVLRSSIREYLCSEAMHGLGIPTTRALALVGSDTPVYRETQETAAVVTRLAQSFIRFGHFEYFFYTGRTAELKQLADFVIREYYPKCQNAEEPYLAFLNAVAERTLQTAAAWQSVGFCHGVMNTDNMSILGLTMDYGPFGFLEHYDRHHICNHSDHEGRYAYNAQPFIAHWNLAALATCFQELVSEQALNQLLEHIPDRFQTAYLAKMRAKLGLQNAQSDDAEFIADLFAALQDNRVDFTLFFRYLSEIQNAHEAPVPQKLAKLFTNGNPQMFHCWLGRYRQRLRAENSSETDRKQRMNQTNPLYILRNYLAEQAIRLARNGDFREIERLRRCLENPFEERPEFADFAEPAPEWAHGLSISCSS